VWTKENIIDKPFDFIEVDLLEHFTGEHPKNIKEIISRHDWEFDYERSKSNIRLKDYLLRFVEKIFGLRLFEYKNYILATSKK